MRATPAALSAGVCVALALAAATALAGFSGSDLFLPMAGRQAGVFPSNWYTTVWIHNPGTDAATARIYLLERGTANPSPPWVDLLVAPGDTEKVENVVESLFHTQVFGALRVTCDTQKLVVTSRVYSKGGGAGEKDSAGQDFAAVPASFAIGVGERTQVLGVYQTEPATDSDYRFNFGFVETTGHATNVRVTAFDATGVSQGSVNLQVRELSQRQVAFKDYFPTVSTENVRLEVEVTSGTGKVIAYGSGIANGSQDPTTFEMDYPARVLAESASAGITGVVAGAGLSGGGSSGIVTVAVSAGDGISVAADAVSLADGGVTAIKLAAGSVTSGAILDGAVSSADAGFNYAGSASKGGAATDLACSGCVGLPEISTSGAASDQVLKYNGSALAWAADSSGITLPYPGITNVAFPGTAFSVTNTGSGVGIRGSSGTGYGGVFVSTTGFGVQGFSSSLGDSGVWGVNNSSGIGVLGSGTSGPGVKGTSSGGGAGVWGESSGSGTGVRGSSRTGYGGVFDTTSGTGVQGWSSALANSGVWGHNNSSGPGVIGSSSTGPGVKGTSSAGSPGTWGDSASGDGAYGHSGNGDGVHGVSDTRDGVVGRGGRWGIYGTNGSSSAWGYLGGSATGVYGNAGGVPANRAAIFDGNVDVNGTLTKDGGAFRIDHPLDPERKYLFHSFVESPDMMNVYNGNAILDENGEVVVELPEWFEVLNRDFRYQLTAIGQPGPNLHVAEKVAGNRFKIAGGQPGMEVSWLLTGVRRDAWANAHRIAIEQEKPAAEQGTFLHPELYGQPEERGIEWARHPEAMKAIRESREESGPKTGS